MTNGGSVSNSEKFESKLENMSKGFDRIERLGVNRNAAIVFKEIMTSDDRVPKRNDINEKYHIRDNFLIEEEKSGRVSVGFTSKSKKGYIARLLNDGWTPVGPGKRGKNKSNKPVVGLHFWEKTEKEAKEPARRSMIVSAQKVINRKLRK